MQEKFVMENAWRIRWVRFGKRTHREACFGGVRLPRRLLRGNSSDSFWKTNSPERPFRGVIKVLSTHFDLRLGTRYRAARPPAISPRGGERQRPLGKLGVTTFEGQASVFDRGERAAYFAKAAKSGRSAVALRAVARLAAVRGSKHVFLRNEPELPTRNYERMWQDGSGL